MATVTKINYNTWQIEDDFVRFFLLEGSKLAVMIDSGVSSVDAKKIASELTALPIILLNTHGDGDHLAGTGAFEEIYMTKSDYDNCHVKDRFPLVSLHEVKDKDIIDLGDRTLEIIAIPGHTLGSIAILDVEKRMLFAGDSVQKGFIFMFGAHRSLECFADSLKKLDSISDKYDTVVASHDEPFLPSDYPSKVLVAWNKVMNNTVDYTETDLHGNTVKAYKTDVCGFYL